MTEITSTNRKDSNIAKAKCKVTGTNKHEQHNRTTHPQQQGNTSLKEQDEYTNQKHSANTYGDMPNKIQRERNPPNKKEKQHRSTQKAKCNAATKFCKYIRQHKPNKL